MKFLNWEKYIENIRPNHLRGRVDDNFIVMEFHEVDGPIQLSLDEYSVVLYSRLRRALGLRYLSEDDFKKPELLNLLWANRDLTKWYS